MRKYLSKSIASLNQNKLKGLLAEVDFRKELTRLGYEDRVSVGGWIFRSTGPSNFGHNTSVVFPETIVPGASYEPSRKLPEPTKRLHTICATFHQIGIRSHYCAPIIAKDDDPFSVEWFSVEMGVPYDTFYEPFPDSLTGFVQRAKPYQYLRHKTDASIIPDYAVPEEFTKEVLRVSFQSAFKSEPSDIDGIFWGRQRTYPLEIKEKTCAADPAMGEYFGIDVGPFVKLAFYAAKRGNLHSIFVVREIDDVVDRNLVAWRFITFDTLAQYASWVPQGGGKNMGGGGSTVIKIPKAEFREMTAANLAALE